MKKNLLLYALLSLSIAPTFTAERGFNESAEVRFPLDDEGCSDVCNALTLTDLCVRNIKAKKALIRELCAYRIKSESICARNLGVAEYACLNQVCANDVNTTTLCVTGTARLNEVCIPYGASVDFTADTPYTLGTPVNFNNIVDDPNGNVLLAPFRYVVPVSGYYAASIQLDSRDITGPDVILGNPVGSLNIKVNGVNRRESFCPYLTFNNTQHVDFAFLLLLNAGDVITIEYNVLIVGPSGTVPYVGTATIIGGFENTIFNIHYIASSCNPANCTPCTACPPCDLDCNPFRPSCVPRP